MTINSQYTNASWIYKIEHNSSHNFLFTSSLIKLWLPLLPVVVSAVPRDEHAKQTHSKKVTPRLLREALEIIGAHN